MANTTHDDASQHRWVLHIDMDAFFASCEQLTRPTLRGRPVLVGGVSGRGVVAGASYEARVFGVHSAMPMMRARRLVGYAGITVRPRFDVYKTASRRVMEIIREEAGLIEQLSVDEAFMEPDELSGATPDEVRQWAGHVRKRIREETGLPSSVGAGAGKQFAKIGSGLAKPDGTFVIPVEDQHAILDPLPVRKLWGIGPVAEAKLADIGVRTIEQFARMSRADVEMTLGKTNGPALWLLAQGHDPRPVAPRAKAKQVSSESTFSDDVTTLDKVNEGIRAALTKAHRRLMNDGRGARTVTVKLKRADFEQHTRSETLPFSTTDWDVLYRVASRLAVDPAVFGAVRLVGVSLSGLESARQEALFPDLDPSQGTNYGALTEVDGDFEAGVVSAANTPTAPVDSDGVSSALTEREAEKPGVDGASTDASHTETSVWPATIDVYHSEYGHGWVQGSGHGVVSVRFETRTTGKGPVRSFPVNTPELTRADPIDSLEWDEWPGLADG
ncbi:DNA polymerase IV [uncultured Corynebacterium sp.]|uniref:DNA polymerase IV n=1 Tax=uncultured Corynebacterium sp. TaxID=159447 RepID=UPI0025EDD586|nr:DNA polymerase IV [uncultured Corynebacterium sp.]